MTNTIQVELANIPLFDLNGPAFLVIYIVALVLATIWCIVRTGKVLEPFDAKGVPPDDLTNPYEIAFLAGGAPRMSQLAITRLLASGGVKIKRHLTSGGHLELTEVPAQFEERIENDLYSAARSGGRKGLPLKEVGKLVQPYAMAVEAHLAKLGLRPTAKEHSGLGLKAAWPMFILIGIGAAKLVLGITRDKPVGILVFLLVITVVIAFAMAASVERLTPTGKNLLKKMRDNFPRPTSGTDLEPAMMATGVALLGPLMLVGLVDYMDMTAQNELRGMAANAGSSSSGGCSSGCGGDGGSGGCGSGCGGCGGD